MTSSRGGALAGIEPARCWRDFEALTKIGRRSHHEERLIEHVRAWAGGNGFELRQDEARNLVVYVPATAGRESAPVVVLRVLRESLGAASLRLVTLDGGNSANAIPREATATCSVSAEHEAAFCAAVEQAAVTIRAAYSKTDRGVDVTVSRAAEAADAWTDEATRSLLDLLAIGPSGPLAMSSDFPGLVETSTSVDEAITEDGRLTLDSLSRSSNSAALPDVIAELDAAARLTGGSFEMIQSDPGWRPDLASALLAASQRAYERLFGEAPTVTAGHAWLETAVIGDRVGGLAMVSFGPQIEGAHSPDGRVSIPTVARFWGLLVGPVDDLSAAP